MKPNENIQHENFYGLIFINVNKTTNKIEETTKYKN